MSFEPYLPIVTSFPQYPGYTILITLFKDVKNSKDIRSKLISGDPEYEYAFIDPTSIYSLEQVLAATYRAVNDTEAGFLRTKNVHSEVIFSLSPNNNIMDGLRRFGISDKSTSLLAIKLIKSESHDTTKLIQETSKPFLEFLENVIDGTLTRVSDEAIEELCDLNLLKKNYKLPATVTTSKQINNAIISAISLRGA